MDDATLFATLIEARAARGEPAGLGLSREAFGGLLARHGLAMPGGLSDAPESPIPAVTDAARRAFVMALQAHLLAEANPELGADNTHCLAAIVTHACLRPDHLWRDLGLSGRDAVSSMLTRFFPALVTRNTGHLRWKKFLASDLAAARGEAPAPAPASGCPGCEDYAQCFPAVHAPVVRH